MCTILFIVVWFGLTLIGIAVALWMIPGTTQLEAIKKGLWKRGVGKDFPDYAVGDRQDADRVISYVEKIIDRQINKARGILPSS
jgi:hypothetical protein